MISYLNTNWIDGTGGSDVEFDVTNTKLRRFQKSRPDSIKVSTIRIVMEHYNYAAIEHAFSLLQGMSYSAIETNVIDSDHKGFEGPYVTQIEARIFE